MSAKIVVADDHPLFREAIKQVFPQIIADYQIFDAESFFELQHLVKQHPDIDLVLMDLHMPGNRGFSGLAMFKAEHPQIAVVMVSASETPQIIRRAFSLGVSGYIPKSSPFEMIKQAINEVMLGEIWLPQEIQQEIDLACEQDDEFVSKISSLTPQQLKVLSMIADGKLNKQIAYELHIQETTIKHHVSAILRKLDVVNRTLAGIMYQQLQVEDSAQRVVEG